MGPMAEIKDSDVRGILENIAKEDGLSLESKINLPFKSIILGGHPLRIHVDKKTYDKVYTLDGLTINLQAEVGKRTRNKNFKEDIRNYLVTKKENVVNWRELSEILVHFDSDTILGPIVDSVDDITLDTINVKSVLVQYTGLPFENLNKSSDFISELKRKYGLEILSKNDGVVYSRLHNLQFSGRLGDIEQVFSKKIYKKDELETGITSVYAAGKTLAEALEKEDF